MIRIKPIFLALLFFLMCSGMFISAAHSENLASTKRIVMFHQNVSWGEVKECAQEWHSSGVSVFMELPFINALVLSVPAEISSADLSADPRVLSV